MADDDDDRMFAHMAPPADGRVYLGAPLAVDALVATVMAAAHNAVKDIRGGKPSEKAMESVVAATEDAAAALSGERKEFAPMRWQSDGGLKAWLKTKYAEIDEDDPIGTRLLEVARRTAKVYREWLTSQVNDTQAQIELSAIKTEAVRDLLGLPNDSMAEQ